MWRLQLLLALCSWSCWSVVRPTAGQGYRPSGATYTLGGSDTFLQLQQLYEKSKSWRQAYRLRPAASCSKTNTASLCAAAGAEARNAYAQLVMATSPQVYSSTNATQVGATKLVAAAGDQQSCETCTAFAVTAAAETAMASVLRVPVQRCSISVQALYFCPESGPTRSCEAGWKLTDALVQLRSRSLPTKACLPYNPDFTGEMTRTQLCEGSCTAPNEFARQGWFDSTEIPSAWQAQRHIRRYGSVITRFDVYSDFKPFFEDFRNADKVYRPKEDAQVLFGHAVLLVGYDNKQQYWVAKNSYGPDWGDGGFFKVAFGACSVLNGTAAEALGVIWTPNSSPAGTQLRVTSAAPSRPNCYYYKVQSEEYLSRIAWLAGIPLHQFMLDNTGTVKDLDAPLTGLQLLLCKPRPGTYVFEAATPTARITSPPPVVILPQTTMKNGSNYSIALNAAGPVTEHPAGEVQLFMWTVTTRQAAGNTGVVVISQQTVQKPSGAASVALPVGSYSVKLTVQSSSGSSATTSQDFVVAGGDAANGTRAVISQPLSYIPAAPSAASRLTTVLLDAEGSAASGQGATLSQIVWAVITLPEKRPVVDAVGRFAQVQLAPGSYQVGLLVIDSLSMNVVALKNVKVGVL